MKSKFCLIPCFLILAAAIAVRAQPCTAADLAKKPGILRASRLVGSTPQMSAAEVAKARATLMKVHQMIATGYQPQGLVGDYSFRFSGGPTGAVFGYTIYLLKYNCDPRDATKSYTETATPTSVKIMANEISMADLSASDTSDNSFRGFLFLRRLPTRSGNVYYLGDETSVSDPKQKAYTWLVTYGDKLPFAVLSRKEYLIITKTRLEKAIRENGNSSGFYNQYVARVDEYLKRAESDLSQPAVVNRLDEERFTGFLREGAGGAFYAIRHDPSYYPPGLPKATAHFFTVTYNVFEGEDVPVYAPNIESIKKAIDPASLRPLLGK